MVYLLRCRDGSLYTGCTKVFEKRLHMHLIGRGSKYVRSRLPVKVAHIEPAIDHSAALKREAAIKRMPKVQKEKLVARYNTHSGDSFLPLTKRML